MIDNGLFRFGGWERALGATGSGYPSLLPRPPQVCISFSICPASAPPAWAWFRDYAFMLCYSCAGRIRVGRISKVINVVTAMIIPPMNMASTMPEVKASFDPWIICCEMSSGNCPATM